MKFLQRCKVNVFSCHYHMNAKISVHFSTSCTGLLLRLSMKAYLLAAASFSKNAQETMAADLQYKFTLSLGFSFLCFQPHSPRRSISVKPHKTERESAFQTL